MTLNGFEGGGFARTVGSEQGVQLAPSHSKAEFFHGLKLAVRPVVVAEVAGLDDGVGGARVIHHQNLLCIRHDPTIP
jgi:hypothetical protein